ncbi:MAG: hypothetical protein Kow0099_11570 [Candidatus Abyssubacteria bacterium]
MKDRRTFSISTVLFPFLFFLVALGLPASCRAQSEETAVQVFERKPVVIQLTTEAGDRITIFGKAFLLERTRLPHYPPILHVQGTPFEMGYQHGVLLADRIEELISGVGSPMMFMMGGWDPATGQAPAQQQLQAGRALCKFAIQKCFLQPIQEKTPDYYEEMQGLAEGLKAAGSPVGLDEILAAVAMAELSQSRKLISDLAAEFASMDAPLYTPSKGCSDFAAWGSATKDGELIHGTNYDNEDFTMGRHGVVFIAKPQTGNAFLGLIHPGSPWPMRGMSIAGITVGEPTSVSSDNDIFTHPQVGHCCHMRRVLQYANNTTEAIAIMRELGGSTGWNIFTTDGKVPTAVDIQVSCTKQGVIHPIEGVDALWSTNQFTAYPGFQGYPEDGPNLVKDQMEYWGVSWEAVDTIEKWRGWMKENRGSNAGDTWARYERLRELLDQNYGQITPQKVIEFMSDPVLSKAGEKIQLSQSVEHLYGDERPIISQKMASVFSAVFVPNEAMAYVAMGAEPAQAGTYWPINLKEHLALLDALAKEEVYVRGVKSAEELLRSWAEETAKELDED